MSLESILFLDIETVPIVYHYEDLGPRMKELFDSKTKFQQRDGIGPEDVYKKAGVFAEFGKIVCISCGYLTKHKGNQQLRIKSFYGHDEKTVLMEFSALLKLKFNSAKHRLCAHNGKEFDFPFLCRRLIINGLPLPEILNIQNKKPWEIAHYDTMEMWKFGDYKHFTSLELLTELFGISSPKDDIKGSDVGRVYYEEDNLEKIVNYCCKDVIALTQVFLRFQGEKLLNDDEIHFVNE